MRPTRKSSSQKGSALIEFAFVMVMLLMMMAGTFAFGRAFWYADALTKSTRDGTRLLTTWLIDDAADITTGVAATKNNVIRMANAANISPPLTLENVVVECAYNGFSFTNCAGATKPVNVRVRITGVSIRLSEWFPFIDATNVTNSTLLNLSPHTTMRYMN